MEHKTIPKNAIKLYTSNIYNNYGFSLITAHKNALIPE